MKKRLIIAGLILALMMVGNVWAETLDIEAGTTDVSVSVAIVDSTTGLAETGVTSATGGLALWYWREGGTVTALTESDLAALDSTHSDGGMYEASDGDYRVDIPDAAFTSGALWVRIGGTATDMVVYGPTIQIVGYDPTSATDLGLSSVASILEDTGTTLPSECCGPYRNYPDPNL